MREIKFRAWNKTARGMLDWYFIKGVPLQELTNQPHLEVMQYTGLKDKNGTEIYEGDIVRDVEDKDHDIFTVPQLSFYQYGNAMHFMIWPEEYEVIGNIHEYPELLENNNSK